MYVNDLPTVIKHWEVALYADDAVFAMIQTQLVCIAPKCSLACYC